VVEELVGLRQQLKVREAIEHVRGCARRLLMMAHARVEIVATSHEKKHPLTTEEGHLLNICLNSFYVNMLGALDNIAWASTFELALRANPREDDWGSRTFCTLSSKAFRDAVSSALPPLGAIVDGLQDWLRDIKRFRDPAAHRLPLSIIPGIMTEEEAARYRDVYQRAWDALLENNIDESDKLFAEANKIGRFIPYLDGPLGADGSYHVAPQLMADDQRRFLDFAHHWVVEMRRAVS
jgi:hypothetical protein